MADAWLSNFSTVADFNVLPGSDTFRGGALIVATTSDVLDTSRDVTLFTDPGWTISGNVTFDATQGATFLSQTAPATLTSPTSDYATFDVAVDVVPLLPPGAAADTAFIACLEHDVGGVVARVCLVRGAFSSPSTLVAIGEAFAGDPHAGFAVAPSGVVTLRLVRNLGRMYGFVGTRTGVDDYTSLTQVLDAVVPLFGEATGSIRLASRTASSNAITSAVFRNYTVRSHGSINGRLFDNKFVPTIRQVVGNVPAATLAEVGLAEISVFGLFGNVSSEESFQYTLPAPRTVGNEIVRTLRTYQDPVVRDPNT